MYWIEESLSESVQQLDDGFERLGDKDSPFLVRGGEERRAEAAAVHAERPDAERQRDELTNEPVCRDLAKWRDDPLATDFPHVDTVACDVLSERARAAREYASRNNYFDRLDETATLGDGKYGRYNDGEREIRLDVSERPFLAQSRPCVLVHELGHALQHALFAPDSGLDEAPTLFDGDPEESEAIDLAHRFHGPFQTYPESDIDPLYESPAEQFAYVFQAAVLEPEAARRIAPQAVERLRTSVVERNAELSGLFDAVEPE